MPSVLWRCWLGGRKDIRPVKNWVMGCWNGYLSGARCRLTYGPADATATHFLLIGFTFLVPAHPGSPEQRAVKRVCVCAARQTTLVKKRFHHYYWAVSSQKDLYELPFASCMLWNIVHIHFDTCQHCIIFAAKKYIFVPCLLASTTASFQYLWRLLIQKQMTNSNINSLRKHAYYKHTVKDYSYKNYMLQYKLQAGLTVTGEVLSYWYKNSINRK